MRAVVRANQREKGSTAIQVLVILVPVFFGFMGFAVDLGRLYLARAEVKSAANSMALAAAQQLIGTDAALANAQSAAQFPIEDSGGYANKYDFGSVPIGVGSSRLQSPAPEPQFYATVGAATEAGDATGDPAGSTTAKHVRVDIQAEAPLTFWGFLSLGQERKVTVAARAVAGVSAPVCQACGVDPVAIVPLSTDDTTDYGFSANTRYTFHFNCTGANQPQAMSGADQRVPYVLIDRYNTEATLFPDESSQAFRIGAGGLPADTNRTRACVQVNNVETIWASAVVGGCIGTKPAVVQNWECGLASRFESTLLTNCDSTAIADADNIATAYTPDSDITDLDDYAAYTGNLRRILTVALVDQIADPTTMTVLGFRQFLLQPDPGSTNLTPGDRNGRFVATYLGSPVPLKQGYMGGCSLTSGPGKVVLHQ